MAEQTLNDGSGNIRIPATVIMDWLEIHDKIFGQLVDRFGPAETWKGRCHDLSIALFDLVPGRVIRGHWIGDVAADSYWQARRLHGFVQHSWYLTEDGLVLDPTAWSFMSPETTSPHIAHFADDLVIYRTYDPGGQIFRGKIRDWSNDVAHTATLIQLEPTVLLPGVSRETYAFFKEQFPSHAKGMRFQEQPSELSLPLDVLRTMMQLPLLNMGPVAWAALADVWAAFSAAGSPSAYCKGLVQLDLRHIILHYPSWVRERLYSIHCYGMEKCGNL